MKMKKHIKTILALTLLSILLFTTACGGSKGETVDSLAEINEIPADGIITKEQFETVAGEAKEIRFTGKAEDGTAYSWTFNANLIKNPQDQNLNITFDNNVLDAVKAKAADAVNAVKLTMADEGLIASADLSVTVPGLWDAASARLVKEENGAFTEVGEVTVTKDETASTTTLAMKVVAMEEAYYVVGTSATSGNQQTDADAPVNNGGETTAEDKTTTENGTTTEKADTTTNKLDTTEKKPDTNTTKKPDTTTEKKPDTSTTKKPDTTTEKKPDTTTAKKPETTTEKKEETKTESSKLTCTISINCATILDNMDDLDPAKKNFVPSNGWILKKTTVTFEEGESVQDILKRVCKSKGIHMESEYTPVYDSAYIEGINQLYEFDCGSESGWTYKVNDWFPNYGVSKYEVSDGDEIEFMYTCDNGADVGDNSAQ